MPNDELGEQGRVVGGSEYVGPCAVLARVLVVRSLFTSPVLPIKLDRGLQTVSGKGSVKVSPNICL
jgi:hypothetical protein